MKYSRRRILKALHIIQDVCARHPCNTCPFSGTDKDGAYCLLSVDRPIRWEIGEKESDWRALHKESEDES